MALTAEIQNYYENITVALTVSLIIFYLFYLKLRDMDVPPGPKGLPLFGYWPFLKSDTCHIQLQELSKKYGDVFSVRISGNLLIHLGSLKAIKEAHVTKSECFNRRFTEDSVFYFIFGEGITFANGELWKVLHKFFVSKFKEYGMNAVKENTASSIHDTLREMVEELRDTKGQPILITDMIMMKCTYIMQRVLFNEHGITIEELQEMNDLYGEMAKGMTGTNLLLIGKYAKYFHFPFMPCIWTLKRCSKRIDDILMDIVNRHKSEYDASHVVDIIDCYLKERDDRRKRGDPTASYLTDKALTSSLNQFVTDGILSVAVFIGSFLMTLVEYPEEQEKIYKEIIDVVGQDRLPTLEDKSKLPYTNAFIYEVTRLSDFFPMFPSMECTKETILYGYRIPKGSITLLNLYAANRNPKDFENPDKFNPSRYIATAEKSRAELPVIFGVGKRVCIGEAFTMMQAFLFLTTIVQNFHLSGLDGSQGSSQLWSTERVKICVHTRSDKSH